METQIIKSGWVEKRSQYLKKWRRRWLVLMTSSLCTYKSETETNKATMMIPLNEITDASPNISDTSNEYSFTITTISERFAMRTFYDSDMCAWLNLINHSRQGNKISCFGSANYYHESKVLSDESLITSFTKMKELLAKREEELLQNLQEIYKIYVDKATQEHQAIAELYRQETDQYNLITSVLDKNSNEIDKIREIQEVTSSYIIAKDLESFNVSKLQVAIQEDNLEKLIKTNIKVCLGNPAEVMIRRTSITRALKWRYTGERIDAITFSVTKDIKLTAVGVCTPYKFGRVTYIKEFQILKGGSTSSNSIYRHSQRVSMQHNPENSIYKVAVENPVLIRRDNKYTVYFLIEGAHTYKCVDCIANVEGPERIVWSFFNSIFSQNHQSNRCDTVCGPIADFYFMIA
jgi:PHR domain/PH domain